MVERARSIQTRLVPLNAHSRLEPTDEAQGEASFTQSLAQNLEPHHSLADARALKASFLPMLDRLESTGPGAHGDDWDDPSDRPLKP